MNARATALIGVVGITAALATTACDDSTTPLVSPTAVAQNTTVTGLVWLHDTDGVKPYANVDVSAWVQLERSGSRVAPVSSGADGRYKFTVPTGASVRLLVHAAAYQPCVTAIAATGNNANRDVHVIVDPAKLGAHLPSELLVDTPTLSGMVFETTATGRQPVPDARLLLDMFSGLGDVSATTLSDADGRYVLCGLGGVASTYVFASKSGYKTADVGTVQLNGNTVRDIEIQR